MSGESRHDRWHQIIDIGAETFDLDDGQLLVGIREGQSINLANIGLTAAGPGSNFQFNSGVDVGGSTVVNATGAGIDASFFPTIGGTGDVINITGGGVPASFQAISSDGDV